jgi:hypothetical protein
MGFYERVGLGEIPASILERLGGLDWEDILFQWGWTARLHFLVG